MASEQGRVKLSKERGRILVTILVQVIRDNEAQKAILVRNGNDQHWIPRSQIKNRRKFDELVEALSIPMWLAVEKGIEFDEEPIEGEIPF